MSLFINYFRQFNFACKILSLIFITTSTTLACEVDISDYVGYQIVYSGTVTGYIDENGQEESSFEGCDYDRVLIIDYRKQVVCQEYGYSYAYMPDIVVLDNGSRRQACIDDEMYDIR